ncbi:hypothetical protein GIB67_026279 [Kingdonia uniflora]|uniref:J domain-containing protein n=1 Tax=Kingdonia uniflora TaxID=39325 RepID=A0A7J7L9W1_9MAGN|nr:hypothetical protein GIB67_026279 [Kingdonia uniflora]
MGSEHTSKKSVRTKKKYLEDAGCSSSSSLSSDSETSSERRSRHRRCREGKHKRSSKESRREKEKSERSRSRGNRKERRDKKVKRRKEESRKSQRGKNVIENDDSTSSNEDSSKQPTSRKNPETIVGDILQEFPGVGNDLKQLLEILDDGQAVDTRGISDRWLVKHLKKLFSSLNLKETDVGVFLLPTTTRPTMEAVGTMILSHLRPNEKEISRSESPKDVQSPPPVVECRQNTNQADKTEFAESLAKDVSSAPRRRVIGPEMPSSELLAAAAAKLAQAEALLREAEDKADDGLFIGPPPAALVAEAASANEAERFEEVSRILGAEIASPYDVLGVNHEMSTDNIKKRYWKTSLMVHPDKCPHPQAHQAFIVLNKAFKDLQDPDKRKALDDKIRHKEEQERFKVELQALREAAQWRRLQGISMEGDEELLAETKLPAQRDEWMTSLPPERKAGVSMQSTTAFSRNNKEGRGDTSAWTDTPTDRAQKAKMNYLEAYNEAAALASNEDKKRTNSDANLVDQYNLSKRSKSMVQKHQEQSVYRPKRKSKQESKKEDEWEGKHPWKPWDREKDLTAGRQSVTLDAENMVKGLSSRFSGGDVQRNFL